MKKFSAALAAILMTFSLLTVSASAAAGGVYTFPEYNFSCALPDTLYAVTQDLTEDDPFLDKMEISYEDELAFLQDNNIILDITNSLGTFELVLEVELDEDYLELGDLNNYFTGGLTEIVEDMKENMTDCTVTDSSFQTINGHPYLFFNYSYTQNGMDWYAVDCISVVDGYDYFFTLTAFTGGFTTGVSESQLEYLETILATITYDGTDAVLPEDATGSISLISLEADEASSVVGSTGVLTPNISLQGLIATVAGGLLIGGLVLYVGLRCKHKKLGIVGAILSFLFSLGFSLLSLLFGMIVAFIFMTIIYRKFKRETAAQKASAAQNTTEPEESAQADHDPWE